MFRGPGKAPALLSGGDCSAVSQFIPGKDLQEVLLLLLLLLLVLFLVLLLLLKIKPIIIKSYFRFTFQGTF